MKYSIIVPVYNSEKFIRECLDSLVKQTYKDYEIIVWNDGSTDNSVAILEEYEKYDVVKVYYDSNSGASLARKKALNYASGTYLLFVDSDDVVSNILLETIDKYMDNGIDLLQFSSITFYNKLSSKDIPVNNSITVTKLNREEFMDDIVRKTIIDGNEAIVLWNKVYRREIFLRIDRDYPHQFLEDYVLNMDYYTNVNSYVKIDAVLYYYRLIQNSLSRRYNTQWFKILKKVHFIKLEFMNCNKLKLNCDYKAAASWFIKYLENMLIQYIPGQVIAKDKVMCILNDRVVLENSSLVKNKLFPVLIQKNAKIAYYYLKFKAIVLSSIRKIKILVKKRG